MSPPLNQPAEPALPLGQSIPVPGVRSLPLSQLLETHRYPEILDQYRRDMAAIEAAERRARVAGFTIFIG